MAENEITDLGRACVWAMIQAAMRLDEARVEAVRGLVGNYPTVRGRAFIFPLDTPRDTDG